MAQKFYLPSTGAAAVSPAYGAWDNTAFADRRAMVRTKISSAMANSQVTVGVLSANTKYLFRQYVSEPIPAQTITGTVTGVVRLSESTLDVNHDQATIRLLVVSNDGATVRGTLLALNWYATTNEYSVDPTRTSRLLALNDAATSVVAQANDRIVLEVGTQNSALAVELDGTIDAVFGDNSGTDLPEDETTTAANNPWIQFSQNLFDQTSTPATVSSVGAAILAGLIIGPLTVASVGAVNPVNTTIFAASTVAGVGAANSLVAGTVAAAGTAGVVADSYSPTAATSVAEGIATFIMRATGTLGDRRDDTGIAHAAPASWPTGTGTLVATQNIIGVSLPSFVIAHVIFGARGVMTQDGAYLSNLRLDISGGSYALSGPWDDIRPYTLGASSYFERCKDARSSPVTTKPAGGAWTWADLLAIPSATVKMDHSNITTVGHFAEIFVSEMYLEAYGPQGSYVVPLTKSLKAGNLRRSFDIIETFNL